VITDSKIGYRAQCGQVQEVLIIQQDQHGETYWSVLPAYGEKITYDNMPLDQALIRHNIALAPELAVNALLEKYKSEISVTTAYSRIREFLKRKEAIMKWLLLPNGTYINLKQIERIVPPQYTLEIFTVYLSSGTNFELSVTDGKYLVDYLLLKKWVRVHTKI
jgi:hypothetical protein